MVMDSSFTLPKGLGTRLVHVFDFYLAHVPSCLMLMSCYACMSYLVGRKSNISRLGVSQAYIGDSIFSFAISISIFGTWMMQYMRSACLLLLRKL
ncbi:hypothetical protein QR685DRAFT_526459 [Neurospora intermedia]|uniref:Uncharacterized protein n=1 Tax=Neurospora intermedia TaxID=5142 RepID=A0ABR3D9S3_NEUIN